MSYFQTLHNKQKPSRGFILNRIHPLSRGLVGAWVMDEGAGSVVNDLSGSNLNGAGTALTWASGPGGFATEFNGTTSLINCGDRIGVTNALNQFTVVSNVFPLTLGEGSTGYIFNKEGTGFIRVAASDATGSNWRFEREYSGATMVLSGGVNSVVQKQWQQVAFVVNYIDGIIYWNGGVLVTGSGAGTVSNETAGIFIGNDSTAAHTWSGLIEYVYYYNRCLAPGEINQLYSDPYVMFK